MTTAGIAHLRIKLDDIEPAVVRRVEVPLTIRLDRLHLVLQAAMGWTNSHLYEIRARDVGWGIPDPDFGDGPLNASKARLIDVLEDVGTRSLKYLYDFGDGWPSLRAKSTLPTQGSQLRTFRLDLLRTRWPPQPRPPENRPRIEGCACRREPAR